VETGDGSHRFVAQVTVYARALGVALAQTTYDTGESSERAALKELLSTLELEGVPGPIRSHPEGVSAADLQPSSLSRPLMS
jgi:hypothetical protein